MIPVPRSREKDGPTSRLCFSTRRGRGFKISKDLHKRLKGTLYKTGVFDIKLIVQRLLAKFENLKTHFQANEKKGYGKDQP